MPDAKVAATRHEMKPDRKFECNLQASASGFEGREPQAPRLDFRGKLVSFIARTRSRSVPSLWCGASIGAFCAHRLRLELRSASLCHLHCSPAPTR